MSQFVAVKGIIRAMSESSETTQPVKAQNPYPVDETLESTQEIKPKPKKKLAGRIGKFFLNLLIFLLIIGLGVFGGYQSGISIRESAQDSLVNQ